MKTSKDHPTFYRKKNITNEYLEAHSSIAFDHEMKGEQVKFGRKSELRSLQLLAILAIHSQNRL